MRIALALLAATSLLAACAPGERLFSDTPHPPVVGTEWRGRAIDDAMVVEPDHVTLVLAPDGQVSGASGCNRFTGQYRLDGRRFALTTPLQSTRMECPPTIMEQERHFLRNLGAVHSVSENPAGLLVMYGDAGALLRFEATSAAMPVAQQTGAQVPAAQPVVTQPIATQPLAAPPSPAQPIPARPR